MQTSKGNYPDAEISQSHSKSSHHNYKAYHNNQ